MIKTFLITLLIISQSAFAIEFELSKEEFLNKFKNDTLILDRSPIIAGLPPSAIKELIQGQKKQFSSFKDEMFYAGILTTNTYRYFIFYEWYDRGCVFGKTEMSKYKNVSDKVAYERALEENKTYEKIDNMYCEKLLNIKIPSSKGLFELPEKLKNIINQNKE